MINGGGQYFVSNWNVQQSGFIKKKTKNQIGVAT